MRRLLFQLHLLLGLTVGTLLVGAGLTGSLLVWRNEIDALLHPELLRVEPAAGHLPWQSLVDVVRAEFPDATISQLQLPRRADESLEITLAGAPPLQVYVDPYRARVLGQRHDDETFANALFAFHSTLFAGAAGELVLGTTALLVLLLATTGLIVWWPGIRQLRSALSVRWSAKWKRVNYDLHRALGFWTSLFLLTVGITASSLIFHDAYMAGLNRITRSPARPKPMLFEAIPAVQPLRLDSIMTLADNALPDRINTYVTVPSTANAAIVVRKKAASELHPSGRSFLYLHPQTGALLGYEDALTAPLGARAYNILYPIHIGRWGGTTTRVLQSFFGLVPLGLFVTGILMWRNRGWGLTAPRGLQRQ